MKEILKKFREAHNYSIKELACYFGGDENLIVGWESGTIEPTISECLILSKLYGVSLDEMFSGVDIKSMIPVECADSFEHEVMLNRIAAHWYN